MKKYLISTINKLILAVLAFLGFSCDPDVPAVEYGMPHADFKAYGSIIDETTLQKLSNIQVVMDGDTVYSNANGEYEIQVTRFPQTQIYTVGFKDVDGALNGSYLATDTIIDFSDVNYTDGDGTWYSGEKSKEINIELSPDDN
ncbi:radical SAM-associated putative lipoprotein [Bacteroidota bacterium]